MTGQAQTGRPSKLLRNLNAKIASIPMILTAVVIFFGGTIWTVVYSFTNSKLLPRLNWSRSSRKRVTALVVDSVAMLA